jgi:hypothetical protein
MWRAAIRRRLDQWPLDAADLDERTSADLAFLARADVRKLLRLHGSVIARSRDRCATPNEDGSQ